MNEWSAEDQLAEREESRITRAAANWRSCLLLFVMLLGLLATPMAVLYRWYADRGQAQLVIPAGSDGRVNRIAYITPNGQLATMAPDGSQARQLTDEAHVFQFPAWAPDGKQLAVVGGSKVLLVDADSEIGSGNGALTLYANGDDAPFYLYWSPDSQHVTFLTNHAEGIALHVVERDATQPASQPIAIGQPFYWDWTPSADELFIHSGGSGANARLEILDLQGQTTYDGFGEAGIFQAPGISSSGRFKAFAALDEEGRSRLQIQDDNGDTRPFETHLGQLAFIWSPAADTLAYRSPSLNGPLHGGPLHLLNAETNDLTLLTNRNVLAFFWSPDGHTIAYFSLAQVNGGDVRVASSAGKQASRSRMLRQQGDLLLELWVVDIESKDQRRLMQFVPTISFLQQFLPYFDQYALSHRIWSPNSDSLVVPVLEDGRSQIAVVSLDRGSVTLIADGVSAFWSYQ